MTRTILHCINSFSERGGGVAFALKSLCETLEGYSHVILALRDDQPVLDLSQARLRLFERTGPFTLSYSRGLESGLHAELQSSPDAMVHVHGMWSGLGSSVDRLRRRSAGLGYVVSPHGMLSPSALDRRRRVKAIMARLWERALLQNAQAVHCLTQVEARHALGFDAGLRVAVQPHSVAFPLSQAGLTQSWAQGREGRKTLLYLGRIHQTKGVLALVDALEARAQAGRGVGFRLAIAGMGAPDSIAALKARIAGTRADISFLGPVFGAAKTRLLQEVHGMILPSQTEGLPMSLIEGAAHGLPLFITRECNLDWVEPAQAGLCLPYGSAGIDALIDRFDSASKPDLAAMGLRAAQIARSLYAPQIVQAGWQDIYARPTPSPTLAPTSALAPGPS
jgi:glycosyltransferase involved in cell wall biosynthesis